MHHTDEYIILLFKSIATYLCRSALRTFERRVAYSNVGYDRIRDL